MLRVCRLERGNSRTGIQAARGRDVEWEPLLRDCSWESAFLVRMEQEDGRQVLLEV